MIKACPRGNMQPVKSLAVMVSFFVDAPKKPYFRHNDCGGKYHKN
ncbi:hypothetical protein HMPREF9296_0152 [Prevotella disiens FB035-09AN]|uniref:Uncharacterized protein n=1 Tax=Prevotella disiens FB035-09AN TaxID=866771 RepID=E1KMM8_9BACT|nr:hypothetical protein HMPREF9296_0152 [Prevotella disiens FB035-09AN]